MKKLWKNIFLASGIVLGISSGAGVTAAILIPKALKAKKGLEQFVQKDGNNPMLNWNKKTKINYVALGDSISSGFSLSYNDIDDAMSFTDFLANDLKNANKLEAYHNYSSSGDTIKKLHKKILSNPSLAYMLGKANLITLTIGANDLIRALKILELGIMDIMDIALQIIRSNNAAPGALNFVTDDKINKNIMRINLKINQQIKKSEETNNPQEILNKVEILELIKRSINQFAQIYKDRDFSSIVAVRESYEQVVFDLIKRNIITLIRDLHQLAPNAKIIVLGYPFVFTQWQDKIINKKNGKKDSFKDIFNKLLIAIEEGATFSIDSNKNKFTSFYKIDDFKIKKSSPMWNEKNKTWSKDPRDGKNQLFTNYIKRPKYWFDKTKTPIERILVEPNFWKRNAVSSSIDYHPTQFGHELIGNSLFSKIYNHLYLTKKDMDYYTNSTPYVEDDIKTKNIDESIVGKNFSRQDETPEVLQNKISSILNVAFSNSDSLVANLFYYTIIDSKVRKIYGYYKNKISNKLSHTIIKAFYKSAQNIEYNDFNDIISIFQDQKIQEEFFDLIQENNNLITNKKNDLYKTKIISLAENINKISSSTKMNLKNKFKKWFEKKDKKNKYNNTKAVITIVVNLLLNHDPVTLMIFDNIYNFTNSKYHKFILDQVWEAKQDLLEAIKLYNENSVTNKLKIQKIISKINEFASKNPKAIKSYNVDIQKMKSNLKDCLKIIGKTSYNKSTTNIILQEVENKLNDSKLSKINNYKDIFNQLKDTKGNYLNIDMIQLYEKYQIVDFFKKYFIAVFPSS